MDKPLSKLWFLGPPAAILLSLFVYYAKFDSVRRWVDKKSPWVAHHVGSHLSPLAEESHASTPAPRPVLQHTVSPPREPQRPQATPTPPPAPTFFAVDGTVDLQKLAADRGAWPPTVTLKAAREFPAVVNGKVVGKIQVATGTETKLVTIKDGKLGVEYQGGGTWLTVEETDLAQRLRH